MNLFFYALSTIVILLFSASHVSAEPDQRTFTSTKLGAKFILVSPGTFVMGTDDSKFRSEYSNLCGLNNSHTVTISKPFYLQATEVTQKQWKSVMGSNPSRFSDCDECPVENVTWAQVRKFIEQLNESEKTVLYRLPTEAEWEYAARAGTITNYYWGDEPECGKANYGSTAKHGEDECDGINPGRTVKAGSFPPNPWGFFDMFGNVHEYVQDCISPRHPHTEVIDQGGRACGDDNRDVSPAGGMTVFKGGCWATQARTINLAFRYAGKPSEAVGAEGETGGYIGFRLARSGEQTPEQAEALLKKALAGREAPPQDCYLLYREGPFEKVHDTSFVKQYTLKPGRFSGTFVKRNGEQFEMNSSWSIMPAVLMPGQKLTVTAETNQKVRIYVLSEKVGEIRPGPKQTVTITIPRINESRLRYTSNELSIRFVVVNNRSMDAGWEYRYETNVFEKGVMLPVRPRESI